MATTGRNRKKNGDERRSSGLHSKEGLHRSAELRSGSRLRLVRSRRSRSRHRSNDDTEISRRQLTQPPLAHIVESPKITSAASTGFTRVGESTFHELAAATLECRVSEAANSPSVGSKGMLAGSGFVFPLASPRGLAFGDVGPNLPFLTSDERIDRVIPLVHHGLFNREFLIHRRQDVRSHRPACSPQTRSRNDRLDRPRPLQQDPYRDPPRAPPCRQDGSDRPSSSQFGYLGRFPIPTPRCSRTSSACDPDDAHRHPTGSRRLLLRRGA